MLRGIPDIIGSDLLKALADTGHGDLIAIVDHFYPPITKAPNAVSIQAKGCGVAQMLDAILKLVPLDVDFEKLFYNMLDAKAKWLYTLPEWADILSEETRRELTKKWRLSGQAVSEKTVGRNDPCPCGSGKKYKKCCGANA